MSIKSTEIIKREITAPLAPQGIERRQRNRWAGRVYSFIRALIMVGLLSAIAVIVIVLVHVLNDPHTTGPVLLVLINANVLLLLVFVLYVGRHLILMFLERRGRLRRSRLPLRFLGVFTILAVLPTVLVSVYSLYMLNQGLESWFSNKVNRALEGSLQVAQAYLAEHEKSLLVETAALAKDPNLTDPTFLLDPLILREVLKYEQERRGLEELSLYDEQGLLMGTGDAASPVATVNIRSFLPDGEVELNSVRAIYGASDQKLTVLASLQSGGWLLTSRSIHPSVLARIDETEEAYKEYYGLLKDREKLRFIFSLFLLLLVIGTLSGAIWVGLKLAGKIVRPVTELVHATNKVSAGDLEVRLTPHDDDEMGILTQSFNRMTQQLKQQRTLVEKKNKELDVRRKTMEALLTGVSAGVIAVGNDGIVRTANKSAREMLNLRTGQRLDKISQPLWGVLQEFLDNPRELWQQQLRVEENGSNLTLLVRLVPQRAGVGKIVAVVITFDDITPLLSAQKVAAWSDVARRLAHEIKNPLTPIQLSAERLKRKYLSRLDEDQDLFQQLTETIIRQTEDMRGMLNEFSDFARMPTPVFEENNLLDIIDEVVLLEKTAHEDIEFETKYEPEKEATYIICDRSHLNRVFTNVLENAINAIKEREKEVVEKGCIKVVVKMSLNDTLSILVQDNGRGLSEDVEIDKLFDPYVTTRKKGTGLGLAIVRRVMDEHDGQVKLQRLKQGGTSVELVLPRRRIDTEPENGVHDSTNTTT